MRGHMNEDFKITNSRRLKNLRLMMRKPKTGANAEHRLKKKVIAAFILGLGSIVVAIYFAV
jgi:hypothetical protein